MTNEREVIIASAVRTPIGSFNGSLSLLAAPKLGSVAIAEALKRAGVPGEDVSEVIMGNVVSAGLGQAPARQASIFAGIPKSVGCTTINKVCGSGLKAVMLATQAIKLSDSDIVVAGGMESMSNTPYLSHDARFGYRMGHGKLIDSMINDGLWDVYNDFHMGSAGELCARECSIPREAQDNFAILSYKRALEAQEKGYFKDEIVPVTIKGRKGDEVVEVDEEPARVKFDKITSLRPAFDKEGTITAANASKISDGASALVVLGADVAEKMGITPIAKVMGYSTAAKEPEWFTTAPADAIDLVLKKTGLSKNDIDLYEINEAFSVVTLAVNQILGLDANKVNISGGAVSLGHPIGASGARILTTLLHNLKRIRKKRGVASLCLGGGEAVALVVEMI
jgi:acetyl-CoA C-acetyltransferase